MVKRFAFFVLLCSVAAFAFATGAHEGDTSAAAQGSGEVYEENGLSADGDVTLKLGFFEGGMGREWIDVAVASFEDRFPNVTVDVTYSPNIGQIIEPRIAAGDDDDMFDIFAPKLDPRPLVEAGKIVSQEDLWDRELYDTAGVTVRDVAIPGIYDTAWRIDGETLSLPVAGWIGGLFYNKVLFDDHGWNQNPTTYDEFVALCEQIKADGYAPMTFTGIHKYNYFALRAKPFEIAQETGRLDEVLSAYREQRGDRYADEASIFAHERMYELGQMGFFVEGVEALNHTQSQMQVLRGDAAMVITGSWVENEMKDATPEGFEWGYMAIPFTNNPEVPIWTLNGAGEGHLIWADKPQINIDWAKEFTLWLWNMNVQEEIAATGGQMPLRADFMADPSRADRVQQAVRAASEYIVNHPVRLETMFTTVSRSDPMFSQAWQLYEQNIVGIVAGEVDPEPILRDAQAMYDQGLANEGAE